MHRRRDAVIGDRDRSGGVSAPVSAEQVDESASLGLRKGDRCDPDRFASVDEDEPTWPSHGGGSPPRHLEGPLEAVLCLEPRRDLPGR